MKTSEIDWYEVGKAERQLRDDAIEFENEMTRIDRTTYQDKDAHRLIVAQKLRDAIWRYSEAINEATNGQVAA